MNYTRNKQLGEISYNIDFKNFKENTKSILLINEPFGSGKTYFIEQLINKIEEEKNVDLLITFQNEEKASFFTEILEGSQKKFISHDDQSVLSFNETNYNFNQFRKFLIDLKKTDTDLFSRLTNLLILKSYSQFFDYNSSYKYENEKDHLQEEISNLIPTKGILRLIFESGRVVIESFIVDLLTTFYPTNETTNIEDYVGKVQKPNITLILDDYESIGYCVTKWLIDDFFYYAFRAKLEDFITYDLKNIPGNFKVSDFFDFKFIISTRESLLTCEKFSNINNYLNYIERITLGDLNKNQIIEILTENKVKSDDFQLGFEKISKGNISILLNLISEYHKNSNTDFSQIYNKISDLILEFHSDIHKNWIIAAAHLDSIEKQGLRCFPIINDKYPQVFDYLKKCSDLLDNDSYQKGIIEFNPLIKEVLKKSLKLDSIQTSIEYENIVKNFNDVKDIIKKLKFEELEALRDLTYFRKINLELNLERNIAHNLEIIDELKVKYPEWFIINKHTISLSANILTILKKFNVLIDTDSKKIKDDKAKKLWEDYKASLQDQNIKFNQEIEDLSLKNKDFNKETFSNKQQYEEHQKLIMEKENKLIELKKRLSTFSTTKPLTASLTNIGLAIIVIMLSMAFPKIFENIENEGSIFVIQIVLYTLSAIFLGFSGIFIYKLYQIYKSKNTIEDLENYISKVEEEKQNHQNEMKRINQEKELIPRKMDDIGLQIASLKEKIKINNEKISDSFI